MNLKESVRQWVLRELPYNRADAKLMEYLNSLDAHRLLVVFHNWMNRLVKTQPRQVRKSRAFERNPMVEQHARDFAQIINDIEQGRDLRKYLSRDVVRVPAQVPEKRKRRADLDLMLNDWGVHHLHISTHVKADGFVSRGETLLFAVFKTHTAYFIDVMEHGDWTSDHILEVLASEWPNDGLIYEIKGMHSLSNPITESQRKTLRSKHCNASFLFKGKEFMPNGGMTASGHTLTAVREADILLDVIDVFEREFSRNPKWLKPDFERHGLLFPEMPEFQFAIREDGYGVIEIKTQAWINLSVGQAT